MPTSPERIDVRDQREIRRWSRLLGVSPSELRSAIAKAGPVLEDIKLQLRLERKPPVPPLADDSRLPRR